MREQANVFVLRWHVNLSFETKSILYWKPISVINAPGKVNRNCKTRKVETSLALV